MTGTRLRSFNRGWAALATAALFAACLLTAGCWDRVEIQERVFVLAVAVDVAEAGADKQPGRARMEGYAHPAPADRYRVTFQLIRFGGAKAGEEKAGGAGQTYVVTGRGPAIFAALRDALGESSKALWFENLQAVIFSQAAIERYGFPPLFDFFRRDAEMRWRAQVYITPGEAGKLLLIKPPTGEPGGIYLANVARRQKKDPHLPTDRTDVSFASQVLDAGADLMFPVVEPAGDTMKIKGAAIFKGERFLGYVDEYTVKGTRIVRATEKSALITFDCPDHPGSAVTFELFRHETILEPYVEGDRVRFTLDIAMRGNLGEVQCGHLHNTMDPDYQIEVQKMIAAEVKRNAEYAVAVGQRLGWEMFYFRRSLQAYKPKDWARIKDRWDEIYPTVQVEVKVRVSIINVGEHR